MMSCGLKRRREDAADDDDERRMVVVNTNMNMGISEILVDSSMTRNGGSRSGHGGTGGGGGGGCQSLYDFAQAATYVLKLFLATTTSDTDVAAVTDPIGQYSPYEPSSHCCYLSPINQVHDGGCICAATILLTPNQMRQWYNAICTNQATQESSHHGRLMTCRTWATEWYSDDMLLAYMNKAAFVRRAPLEHIFYDPSFYHKLHSMMQDTQFDNHSDDEFLSHWNGGRPRIMTHATHLFIPVNSCGSHWTFVHVDFDNGYIEEIDSLLLTRPPPPIYGYRVKMAPLRMEEYDSPVSVVGFALARLSHMQQMRIDYNQHHNRHHHSKFNTLSAKQMHMLELSNDDTTTTTTTMAGFKTTRRSLFDQNDRHNCGPIALMGMEFLSVYFSNLAEAQRRQIGEDEYAVPQQQSPIMALALYGNQEQCMLTWQQHQQWPQYMDKVRTNLEAIRMNNTLRAQSINTILMNDLRRLIAISCL